MPATRILIDVDNGEYHHLSQDEILGQTAIVRGSYQYQRAYQRLYTALCDCS